MNAHQNKKKALVVIYGCPPRFPTVKAMGSMFRRRLVISITLFRLGKDRDIVFSGTSDEHEVASAFFTQMNREKLPYHFASVTTDTILSLDFSEYSEVIHVSSWWHLPRVKNQCKYHNKKLFQISKFRTGSNVPDLQELMFMFREVLAWAKLVYFRYIAPEKCDSNKST